jgi:hypothetical protein
MEWMVLCLGWGQEDVDEAETEGKRLRRAEISGLEGGGGTREEMVEEEVVGGEGGEEEGLVGKWRRPCEKSIVTEFVLRKSAPRIGWDTLACKNLWEK